MGTREKLSGFTEGKTRRLSLFSPLHYGWFKISTHPVNKLLSTGTRKARKERERERERERETTHNWRKKKWRNISSTLVRSRQFRKFFTDYVKWSIQMVILLSYYFVDFSIITFSSLSFFLLLFFFLSFLFSLKIDMKYRKEERRIDTHFQDILCTRVCGWT